MLTDWAFTLGADVASVMLNLIPAPLFSDLSGPAATVGAFVGPYVSSADYMFPVHEAVYLLGLMLSIRFLTMVVAWTFRVWQMLPVFGH